MNKLKIFFGYLILFGIWFLGFGILFLDIAEAQTSPQFLVSWQAESYVPSWYQGKIFPTKNSAVEISFELLDKGEIVDLSKTKVRWYLDDKLVRNEDNGLGIKFLRFVNRNYPGENTEIRITITDYKGETLDKIIVIPSVGPEAVIDIPYLERKIDVGVSNFLVHPFFFNAKNPDNFNIEWNVMGKKSDVGDDPWQLNLNIDPRTPKGTEINLSVSVKLLQKLEFASRDIKLIVK